MGSEMCIRDRPPYFAEQVKTAIKLASAMDVERQALLGRASGLVLALRHQGFETAGSNSQIVPVVLGKNEDTLQAAEYLQKAAALNTPVADQARIALARLDASANAMRGQ